MMPDDALAERWAMVAARVRLTPRHIGRHVGRVAHPEQLPAPMTEAELQRNVIQAARAAGYDLIYHTRYSIGSAPGFPDVLLACSDGWHLRLIVAELKREGKDPTAAQMDWLDRFTLLAALTHGTRADVQVHTWRPQDWLDGSIIRILQAPLAPSA